MKPGRRNRIRNKGTDKAVIDDQMATWARIKERCGVHASESYQAIRGIGVTPAELASPDFSCTDCPIFLRCKLGGGTL